MAHIGDLIEGVRSKGAPRFSEFLDERQQALCLPLAQRSGLPFLFFGGWQDASRRMLGVFPEYWEAQGEDFPLAVLTARIPKGFSLCHRDFLGALMNLGIKREMVGDILVDGQGAWVFLQKRLAPLVLQIDVYKRQVEYIADKRRLGAKTMFATHYHELTALEEDLEGVKNYNIAVKRQGEDVIFLRRSVPGGADDSYGIYVSKLAGIPDPVIQRAGEMCIRDRLYRRRRLPRVLRP